MRRWLASLLCFTTIVGALSAASFEDATRAPLATKPGRGRVALVAGDLKFDSADLPALGVDERAIAARVWVDIEPAKGANPSADPFAAFAQASSESTDPSGRDKSTPVVRNEIDMDAAFPGDDRALAERMSHAPCIVLTGGTWSDWWVCANPKHKLTRLGSAILEAHRRGALVVGVGASAAYLAHWSVLERSAISRPVRDPHETGLDVVAEGLGLVDDVCIDLALGGRTTPSRMLRATRTSDAKLAVWLQGPVAWIDDPETNTCTVRGAGVALAFDFERARRNRAEIDGARLSAIVGGATYDRRARTVRGPDATKSAESKAPVVDAGGAALEPVRLAAILSHETLGERGIELCDADECVRLALDEGSKRVSASWTNVRFDFVVPARDTATPPK